MIGATPRLLPFFLFARMLEAMIYLRKALLDPTAVYANPIEVVTDASLTREQKIEILRSWEYDARALEVAEEEGGMPVSRPEMFDLVINALRRIGAKRDTEHTPPTK
ncbi:MAG: hypothetical protein R3268_01905 [Acidiferrobacterales bacterium]|nr:hypothetical protein [Acidiferrobacterales bacterium]